MKLHCRMNALLAALLLAGAVAHGADSDAVFADIGHIESALAAITGLEFKRPVPYAVIGRDQLRRYLNDRAKSALKPADIRAEEITLRLFGLIPADFDLKQTTVDLLTEQAAAFYDYHSKKLYILAGGTGAEQRTALAHELAHALADQHFRLDKFIRGGAKSDDAATARLAVMEGQASWLMSAYMSREAGGPPNVPEAVLNMMAQSVADSASEYPVFAKAPLYIRESLVFPYSAGLLFQDALFHKLGAESFRAVFEQPPSSTQQILHPAKYLDHSNPELPALAEVADRRGFRVLAEGAMGEIDWRVLLAQYTSRPEGERAAARLRGSRYRLLEHKRAGYPVLEYASAWDSEDAAREFLDLYRRVLAGKWKRPEIDSQAGVEVYGRGDSGYFRVWREGAAVNAIEGARSPLH